jgi:hypothetical protein
LITNNDAPQSVGLLWTSDQSVAETSTWQHTTLTTEKHPCPGGIRIHDLSRRAAEDLRLRLRDHLDRRYLIHKIINSIFVKANCSPYNNKISISIIPQVP